MRNNKASKTSVPLVGKDRSKYKAEDKVEIFSDTMG